MLSVLYRSSLAERRVDAGLIAAALALEPRDDVGIEAKRQLDTSKNLLARSSGS